MSTDLTLHIATQCAPVLLGLKMSNILITHPDNENQVYELFHGTEFSVSRLVESRDRMSFLIYRRSWLKSYVALEANAEFLNNLGYGKLTLEAQIQRMAHGYGDYLAGKADFPHEMGIFLGYPLEDVQGFINHQGKNYLYSGYWKVYQNVEQAKATFAGYDRARKWLCQLVEKGVFMGRKEDLKWIESM